MFELVLFLKMKVFLMFSVCLTVEGVFYPTGSLIHVVFLSPLGPSWASSAVCVCENVCVHPSYLPAEACVCVPLQDACRSAPTLHDTPSAYRRTSYLWFLISLLLFNFLLVCFTLSCVFVTRPAHSWLPHIPHSDVLP